MILLKRFIILCVFLTTSLMPQTQSQISDSKFQISNLKSPKIVVTKSMRMLELFDGDKLVKRCKIAVGFSPAGDKAVEGDGRTPEGKFYVFTKNDQSKYHLSLGLSYPGIKDAKRGLVDGQISQDEYDEIVNAVREHKMPPQKTALGGEIYIHGGGSGGDWTDGCVAVTDDEIREIFDAVSVGTQVTILP